ncbi:hypothetical protein V6R21_13295 [Limibacter armeniacum]|uniref:hypothetical protein n=1 Tax=Limibacter armeniacum TaxID=466084 RepID=UPI002FE6574C
MKRLFPLAIALTLFTACGDDDQGPSGPVIDENGNLNIIASDSIIIGSSQILNDINVNGAITITESSTIGNNLNINEGGRVYIQMNTPTDTLWVDGDMNINHQLEIRNGTVLLTGNLNNNSDGQVLIADALYIGGDVNNNNILTQSADTLSIEGTLNNNSGGYIYSTSVIEVGKDLNNNDIFEISGGTLSVGGDMNNNGGANFSTNNTTFIRGNLMNSGTISGCNLINVEGENNACSGLEE